MKKLAVLFFLAGFIPVSYAQHSCFSIINTGVKNDSDKLVIQYKILNTTDTEINLVNRFKHTFIEKYYWSITIIDSLGNRYENDIAIKRRPIGKDDFIRIKPDSSATITYSLKKSEFMIYNRELMESSKYPYQFVGKLSYPLSVSLHYQCDGYYYTSGGQKKKKLQNASFDCRSDVMSIEELK